MLILEKIIKTYRDRLQFFDSILYPILSFKFLSPILSLSLIIQSPSRDLLDIELQNLLHRTKPTDHFHIFKYPDILKKISTKDLFRRYVETIEVIFPEISEIIFLRLLSIKTPFVGIIIARKIDRNKQYYLDCYSRFVNMDYGLSINTTLKNQILMRGKKFVCRSCDDCEYLMGKYKNNKALLRLINILAG